MSLVKKYGKFNLPRLHNRSRAEGDSVKLSLVTICGKCYLDFTSFVKKSLIKMYSKNMI